MEVKKNVRSVSKKVIPAKKADMGSEYHNNILAEVQIVSVVIYHRWINFENLNICVSPSFSFHEVYSCLGIYF